MTFLKKLGQIIATGVEIFTGILPIIQKAYPNAPYQTISKDLDAISQIVVQAEAMGAALGLSGADKLRAATGPVIQILMQSEILAGKQITDAAALNTAAQNAINAVVAMLNAIHPDAATTAPIVSK